MKIAILANKEKSFVRPLAKSLQRMLQELSVEPIIFDRGLSDIKLYPQSKNYFKKQLIEPYRNFRFHNLISRLKEFDAVIVVGHVPSAFMKYFMRDDLLRQLLPDTPVILYDLVYLPTRGSWAKYLKEGNPEYGISERGHFGLERYDYYLCVSVVSENPLPEGSHPYSLIGVNLDDGTLYPEQKNEFIALLDFERSDHLEERKIQLEALQETNTKYIKLVGSYPISKIREIYRKCSMYFIAHRESFGLPICEVQACGGYIFTPYSNWCPSHWIKEDLKIPGTGALSSNFIVYENSKQKLIEEIIKVKSQFNPNEVRRTFFKYHPQLFYGNIKELEKFIEMLKNSKIHSKSHESYHSLIPNSEKLSLTNKAN